MLLVHRYGNALWSLYYKVPYASQIQTNNTSTSLRGIMPETVSLPFTLLNPTVGLSGCLMLNGISALFRLYFPITYLLFSRFHLALDDYDNDNNNIIIIIIQKFK